MNGKERIQAVFKKAESEGRAALVMFITTGFPSVESTAPTLKALADAGADVIEVGMPFSDPLAEGPTIQKSSHAALLNGTTPETCFQAVREARQAGVATPMVLMGYYNPILAMGEAEFCARAAEAGADGLIVPDLPTFEARTLNDECDRNGLSLVPLLALTSTPEGVEEACERASGFVYCVSVLGVTGAREQVGDRVEQLVKLVRSKSDLPVAVGFGISTAEHVARVATYADGAVIGSALVNATADGPAESAPERAAAYTKSVLPGTKRVPVAK